MMGGSRKASTPDGPGAPACSASAMPGAGAALSAAVAPSSTASSAAAVCHCSILLYTRLPLLLSPWPCSSSAQPSQICSARQFQILEPKREEGLCPCMQEVHRTHLIMYVPCRF